MIVANVPFCTFQVTPSTLATALRRSTSRPTFTPLISPACGKPEIPGLIVVPRISWPLDRALAGSSAFSFGSSAIPETTSWVGMAVEAADGAALPGSELADELALAPDELALLDELELPEELQPASASPQATASVAVTASRRGRCNGRRGGLSAGTGLTFRLGSALAGAAAKQDGAQEPAGELVARPGDQAGRRPGLDDPPAVEEHDGVGDLARE